MTHQRHPCTGRNVLYAGTITTAHSGGPGGRRQPPQPGKHARLVASGVTKQSKYAGIGASVPGGIRRARAAAMDDAPRAPGLLDRAKRMVGLAA